MMNIIDSLIQREGGFVDHPNDRGGPTKYGITAKTLADYLGRDVTKKDVRQMSKRTARTIYRESYVDEPGFDMIDDPVLQELVVDAGVHHGTHKATELLQEAAGTTVDGIFGPITEETVNSQDVDALSIRFLAARIRFMGQIVNNDHDQSVFIEGWLNRATSFLDDIAEEL